MTKVVAANLFWTYWLLKILWHINKDGQEDGTASRNQREKNVEEKATWVILGKKS